MLSVGGGCIRIADVTLLVRVNPARSYSTTATNTTASTITTAHADRAVQVEGFIRAGLARASSGLEGDRLLAYDQRADRNTIARQRRANR